MVQEFDEINNNQNNLSFNEGTHFIFNFVRREQKNGHVLILFK
jgi:hypothetical protein